MDEEILMKHYELGAHPKIKLIAMRLLDEKREYEITASVSARDALPYGLHLFDIEIPVIFLHDVLHGVVETMNGKMIKVVVYDIEDGKFCSQLYIATSEEKYFTIEIATPDAFVIAKRCSVPVYVMKSVFEKEKTMKGKRLCWYEYDRDYTLETLNNATPEELQQQSLEELEIFLEKAIESEDYALAKKLKDAINACQK